MTGFIDWITDVADISPETLFYIFLGMAALSFILLCIILLSMRKNSKKKKEAKSEAALEKANAEEVSNSSGSLNDIQIKKESHEPVPPITKEEIMSEITPLTNEGVIKEADEVAPPIKEEIPEEPETLIESKPELPPIFSSVYLEPKADEALLNEEELALEPDDFDSTQEMATAFNMNFSFDDENKDLSSEVISEEPVKPPTIATAFELSPLLQNEISEEPVSLFTPEPSVSEPVQEEEVLTADILRNRLAKLQKPKDSEEELSDILNQMGLNNPEIVQSDDEEKVILGR